MSIKGSSESVIGFDKYGITSTTRCVAKAFQTEIRSVRTAIGTYPPYELTTKQGPLTLKVTFGIARILIPKQTFTKLAAVYFISISFHARTARGFVIEGKRI